MKEAYASKIEFDDEMNIKQIKMKWIFITWWYVAMAISRQIRVPSHLG